MAVFAGIAVGAAQSPSEAPVLLLGASAMLGAHYVAKRQFKRAIECLTPAARAEHGKAQVWLGYAYSGLKKRKLCATSPRSTAILGPRSPLRLVRSTSL